VVSISDSQREPLPQANYVGTVLHGLPKDLLRRGPGAGGYLAFLGRISPEKAPDAAIRIAAGACMPLKVAAKVDRVDEGYFRSTIEPLLSLSTVEFVGEIGEDRKSEFLGNAAGLLFPIAWREPFGLVMIEAMACGTPVIAFENGSVPEILEDGVTGFIVHDEQEAIEAVGRIGTLDRERIRGEFERRFTAQHMAKNYLELFARLREDAAHWNRPLAEGVAVQAARLPGAGVQRLIPSAHAPLSPPTELVLCRDTEAAVSVRP
jgi:glycosyltransferase involved in cell wall biosynthesis